MVHCQVCCRYVQIRNLPCIDFINMWVRQEFIVMSSNHARYYVGLKMNLAWVGVCLWEVKWIDKCTCSSLLQEFLCSYGWQPRGDFLAFPGGPCAATLSYTVHLVKPGNLSYLYQFADRDIIFDFEVTFIGAVFWQAFC